MRIPVFSILLLLSGLNALAGNVKIELHLVWGTDEKTSPNSEHKPVSHELKKQMQALHLKWTNYFDVKQLNIDLPPMGVKKTPLSSKCEVEIKDLGHSKFQVILIGKGEEVINRTQSLPKGETLVLGGNAPASTSWYVVLKRIE